MGQKVSPIGMRVGIIKDWEAKWYAEKDFAKFLAEDNAVRKYLNKELKDAIISNIEIERTSETVTLTINVARPGVVIGQEGQRIETIKKRLAKLVSAKNVKVNVKEVANQDLDATIVAKWIANELENRASFRAVQKKAVQRVMKAGAKGIKTSVSGRLGGADIARSEGYSEGIVPLQTLRSDIDYASVTAMTTYGILGVKVWICRGEVLPQKKNNKETAEKKGE